MLMSSPPVPVELGTTRLLLPTTRDHRHEPLPSRAHSTVHVQSSLGSEGAEHTPRPKRDRSQRCCPMSHGTCGQPRVPGPHSWCQQADPTCCATQDGVPDFCAVSRGTSGQPKSFVDLNQGRHCVAGLPAKGPSPVGQWRLPRIADQGPWHQEAPPPPPPALPTVMCVTDSLCDATRVPELSSQTRTLQQARPRAQCRLQT